MKTYDELYDDIKRALDEGMELGGEDWKNGANFAYRYVLDRLEEIRASAIRPHSNYGEYTCICGKLVEHLCDSCSGCGQKLDWTDEED